MPHSLRIYAKMGKIMQNTKNRNRITSIAVSSWCHRLANLILPDTIFRNKFDSHTLFCYFLQLNGVKNQLYI